MSQNLSGKASPTVERGALAAATTISVDHLIQLRGREALRLLLEAHDYATHWPEGSWEFALDIKTLIRNGLSPNDLRWLLSRGLLLHGLETTPLGEEQRSFRAAGVRRFGNASCFVLTGAGVAFIRQADDDVPQVVMHPPISHRPEAAKRPIWDCDRQELRLGVTIVKRFKAPAPNQELILAAFEEEGWPVHIDDPLPPHPDQEPRRRLHDTINSLNRNQKAPLLRFIGDGSGQGVRWELSSLNGHNGNGHSPPNGHGLP